MQRRPDSRGPTPPAASAPSAELTAPRVSPRVGRWASGSRPPAIVWGDGLPRLPKPPARGACRPGGGTARPADETKTGRGGAAMLWTDPHATGEGPHANGGTDDGVRRRIDHRHVVGGAIGDVGAVDRRVHPHAKGTGPHTN